LRRIVWIKGVMFLLAVSFLWGCASRRDVVILDKETSRLQSQVSSQQKEKESLQKDLEKLQKDFKALQAEVTGETKKVQADLLLRVENLQT